MRTWLSLGFVFCGCNWPTHCVPDLGPCGEPSLASPAPDLRTDMMNCGLDRSAGGGGKDRPELLINPPSPSTFSIEMKPLQLLPYSLDTFLVTVRAYRDCVAAGACSKPQPCTDPSPIPTWTDVAGANDGKPINCLAWREANNFCAWAKTGGRLPTEAEYEYAASGGQVGDRYPWGTVPPTVVDQPQRLCWRKSDGPCEVGIFQRTLAGVNNDCGFADLAGNVWEWTDSVWMDGTNYIYPEARCQGVAPGENCSIRTAGWNQTEADPQFPDKFKTRWRQGRYGESFGVRHDYVGFRCARSR